MKYYLREESITESLVGAIRNLFAPKPKMVVKNAPPTKTPSQRKSERTQAAKAKAAYDARETEETQGDN